MAGLAWKWPRTRLPVGASALGVFVLCWLYVFPVYRLPDEKEIVQGVLLQQGKAWRRNHTAVAGFRYRRLKGGRGRAPSPPQTLRCQPRPSAAAAPSPVPTLSALPNFCGGLVLGRAGKGPECSRVLLRQGGLSGRPWPERGCGRDLPSAEARSSGWVKCRQLRGLPSPPGGKLGFLLVL